MTSSSLADALLVIAEAFLGGKAAAADDPEVYQVIVHVGTNAITLAAPDQLPRPGAFPRKRRNRRPRCRATRPIRRAAMSRTARPSASGTAQMIACSSTLSWMLHDSAGKLLDLGGGAPAEHRAAPGRPGTG